MTRAQRHRMLYQKWRESGLSHKQAMRNFPSSMHDQILKDIASSDDAELLTGCLSILFTMVATAVLWVIIETMRYASSN